MNLIFRFSCKVALVGLITILIIISRSYSQASIFDNDTVSYVVYKLDKDEMFKNINQFYFDIGQPLSNQLDTLPASIKVYKNKNGLFSWNVQGDYLRTTFDDIKDLNKIEWDEFHSIIKENGNQVPPFKAFKKGDEIVYQTSGKKILNLFKISFKNKTSYISSFLEGNYSSRFKSNDLNLMYKGEKSFDYKGIKLACYNFESINANYNDGLRLFEISQNSILIDKVSLLPVQISRRFIYRFYLNERNAAQREGEPGYYLRYETVIIEAK